MNCIFFTKPKKATLEFLKFLVKTKDNILGVIVVGKERWRETEFYAYCIENHIRIVDFTDADSFLDKNRNNIDTIYCNTFPKRIKDSWIQMAKLEAINFHTAPLPEYRGVFGFNFAILNKEKSYGVTAHKLASGFDTGDIIKVERFPYDCEKGNVRELVDISETVLLELFQEIHNLLKCGKTLKKDSQQTKDGRYYSRRDFDSAKKINLNDSTEEIEQKIRAFWYPPFEGAYIEIDGKHYTLVTEELLQDFRTF